MVCNIICKCEYARHQLSRSDILIASQSSKVHFQQALSATRSMDDTPDNTQAPAEDASKNKKVHSCPYPDCPKQYKQLSGLRYHISHVRQRYETIEDIYLLYVLILGSPS